MVTFVLRTITLHPVIESGHWSISVVARTLWLSAVLSLQLDDEPMNRGGVSATEEYREAVYAYNEWKSTSLTVWPRGGVRQHYPRPCASSTATPTTHSISLAITRHGVILRDLQYLPLSLPLLLIARNRSRGNTRHRRTINSGRQLVRLPISRFCHQSNCVVYLPQGCRSSGHCCFDDSVSIHLSRQCMWNTCVHVPQTFIRGIRMDTYSKDSRRLALCRQDNNSRMPVDRFRTGRPRRRRRRPCTPRLYLRNDTVYVVLLMCPISRPLPADMTLLSSS